MLDLVLDPVLSKLRFTFSRYCRSGIVGDLCGCWRCRGVSKSRMRFAIKEKREADLIDLAFKAGTRHGRALDNIGHESKVTGDAGDLAKQLRRMKRRGQVETRKRSKVLLRKFTEAYRKGKQE